MTRSSTLTFCVSHAIKFYPLLNSQPLVYSRHVYMRHYCTCSLQETELCATGWAKKSPTPETHGSGIWSKDIRKHTRPPSYRGKQTPPKVVQFWPKGKFLSESHLVMNMILYINKTQHRIILKQRVLCPTSEHWSAASRVSLLMIQRKARKTYPANPSLKAKTDPDFSILAEALMGEILL